MRLTAVLLLLGGLAVHPGGAQQPAAAASPAGTGGKQVHRVLPPPKPLTVQGMAARSTAQTMAAHADKPLTQIPAFAVTGLDGKAADIGSFGMSGHWLLLYRPERCAACDKAMAALAKSESPLFKQGTPYVIVVRGSGGRSTYGMLDKLKGTYPTLANATWVEDAEGACFAALKPHGEPVLYAVSGNDIAWAVHGTLNDPASLERLASSWLASTSKPRASAGATPATASVNNTTARTTVVPPR